MSGRCPQRPRYLYSNLKIFVARVHLKKGSRLRCRRLKEYQIQNDLTPRTSQSGSSRLQDL